ncbi:hypothetical protein IJ101_01515 [Candidatus Saccharibacteria bacterium]|nr:hypothetical protein [Candidatus Saccharibacteria bacterium]
MANRNKHLNPSQTFEPKRCWVGDVHKICYDSREDAEAAARVAEYDHHIEGRLSVYKCEYGDHWHLSSK